VKAQPQFYDRSKGSVQRTITMSNPNEVFEEFVNRSRNGHILPNEKGNFNGLNKKNSNSRDSNKRNTQIK
jgi:hypothetical protein